MTALCHAAEDRYAAVVETVTLIRTGQRQQKKIKVGGLLNY